MFLQVKGTHYQNNMPIKIENHNLYYQNQNIFERGDIEFNKQYLIGKTTKKVSLNLLALQEKIINVKDSITQQIDQLLNIIKNIPNQQHYDQSYLKTCTINFLDQLRRLDDNLKYELHSYNVKFDRDMEIWKEIDDQIPYDPPQSENILAIIKIMNNLNIRDKVLFKLHKYHLMSNAQQYAILIICTSGIQIINKGLIQFYTRIN